MSEYLYDYNGNLDYKFGKTTDTKCHVSYDPSIIDDRFKINGKTHISNKEEADKYYKEQMSQMTDLSSSSKIAKGALSSAMGKDERKFKLNSLIKTGECKTLKSASKLIGVSETTIIKYLKELNIQLYDTSKRKYVGSQSKDATIIKI